MLYPFAPPQYYGYRYEKRGRVWRLVPPGETPARDGWWDLYRRRGVEPAPPDYVDYWTGTYLGVAYLDEARDRRAAGEEARGAVCLAVAERLGRRSEKARHYLGAYAEARGELERAREHYGAALALEPTYREAREGLARVYTLMGWEEEAAREREALGALYPEGGGVR
jgi:tetratricopeptide (TPR) repeat protein